MNSKSLEVKRHFIKDKVIVGIDPAKKKHQAVILDTAGIPVCNSFKFSNNFKGFNNDMWNIIKTHIRDLNPNNVVFAVEISINFWQKLCAFLCQKGFTVLIQRPLCHQVLAIKYHLNLKYEGLGGKLVAFYSWHCEIPIDSKVQQAYSFLAVLVVWINQVYSILYKQHQ